MKKEFVLVFLIVFGLFFTNTISQSLTETSPIGGDSVKVAETIPIRPDSLGLYWIS